MFNQNGNTQDVWREDFPYTKRLAYFQHAYNSPMPRSAVQEVLEYFLSQTYLGVVQSEANRNVEDARINLSKTIDVKTEEIAFTQSYTEGLNIVTSNIDWNGKDNIVIGEGDYFSTFIHFVNLIKNKKNIEIRIIPYEEEGVVSVNKAKELIDEKTALVHLVHVSNERGTIQPVGNIFNYANKIGVSTVVDAAQSTGIVPHTMKSLNCDYYSSVGKKWLMGPVGTAFFWCKEELIEDMVPPIAGKHVIKHDLNDVQFVNTAERFESTTLNHPGIVGLNAAIRYVNNIGINKIDKCIKKTVKHLMVRLNEECDVDIIGTKNIDLRTGITCIVLKGHDSNNVVAELKNRYSIFTDARGLGTPLNPNECKSIRISTHFYNNHQDIEKLVDALKNIQNG